MQKYGHIHFSYMHPNKIVASRPTCVATLCALALSGCSQGYVVRDEQVYFHGWNEGAGRFEHVVSGADVKSFQVIDDFFAKDRIQAYAYGWPLLNSDPGTFQVLAPEKAHDKKACYIGSPGWSDPSKQKPSGFIEAYLISNNQVVFRYWREDGNPRESVVSDADIGTFEALSFGYAKDKNRVFWRGRPIAGVDVSTFTVINACDTRDKNGPAHWTLERR